MPTESNSSYSIKATKFHKVVQQSLLVANLLKYIRKMYEISQYLMQLWHKIVLIFIGPRIRRIAAAMRSNYSIPALSAYSCVIRMSHFT